MAIYDFFSGYSGFLTLELLPLLTGEELD